MRKSQRRRSEMFGVIEQWKESGLSQSAFCFEHGLSKSGFGYWIARYRKAHKIPATMRTRDYPLSGSQAESFLTVEVSEKDQQQTYTRDNSLTDVEITYPDGTNLRIGSSVELDQLKILLNPL